MVHMIQKGHLSACHSITQQTRLPLRLLHALEHLLLRHCPGGSSGRRPMPETQTAQPVSLAEDEQQLAIKGLAVASECSVEPGAERGRFCVCWS